MTLVNQAECSEYLLPFQGGGIAINVVDNLMVAHHQASGTSATFDVALKGESDGHISHHKPIGEPIKIHHPTSLTATASSSDKSTSGLAWPLTQILLCWLSAIKVQCQKVCF